MNIVAVYPLQPVSKPSAARARRAVSARALPFPMDNKVTPPQL
jgi:hypothetical protein